MRWINRLAIVIALTETTFAIAKTPDRPLSTVAHSSLQAAPVAATGARKDAAPVDASERQGCKPIGLSEGEAYFRAINPDAWKNIPQQYDCSQKGASN